MALIFALDLNAPLAVKLGGLFPKCFLVASKIQVWLVRAAQPRGATRRWWLCHEPVPALPHPQDIIDNANDYLLSKPALAPAEVFDSRLSLHESLMLKYKVNDGERT